MNERQRADALWKVIEPTLKGQEDKLVAIELESGEYFVGESAEDACDKANAKHPGKLVYLKRVGRRAAFFIGAVAR